MRGGTTIEIDRSASLSLTGIEIVLIEDNPDDAILIRRMLNGRHEGSAGLTHFERIDEAVEALRSNDASCLLLDLSLPDSSGLEGLRRVREAAPALPVVILTGLADEEMALQALEAGAQEYLSKDELDAALLTRTIRYAIERERIARALSLKSTIMAAMAEGVCLVRASDMTIVYVNEMWNQMLGYGAGELVGKPVSLVNAGSGSAGAMLATTDSGALEGGGVWRGEIENVKRDGTSIWCRANVSAFQHHEHGLVFVAVHTDVTERKKAEDESRHLASIVDSSQDAIIGHTLDGLITSWNRGAAGLYGYPAEAVIGQPISTCVPPGRRDEMSVALARIERGESIGNLETVHVDNEGRLIDLELTFSPIRDVDGEITGISTVARDISGRKLAARHAKAQHEATRVLAEGTDLDLALPSLLAAVGASIGWPVGAFWMPAEDCSENVLQCAAFWHDSAVVTATAFEAASAGLAIGPGEGLPGRVWESGLPRWVPDVGIEKHSLRTEAALRDGLHACILIPAVSGGEVVAVIEFLDSEARPLEQAQLDILNPLSDQIGEFIVRKQGEAALERSRHQTRRIIETAQEAFVCVDERGSICDWNSQAAATFGWSRDDALGRQASELIIPERGRATFRRGLERLFAAGGGSALDEPLEMTALRRDGSEFTAELTVSFLGSGGGHTLNAFVRDITDRKEHEDSLERTNEELGRFAGIASHDLSNPLRTISGFAHLLRSNRSAELDERGQEHIERIIGGAARMQDLIDDLLLYAKSGRMDIDPEPIDLGSLVAEVLLDIEHDVDEHAARIEAGDLPEVSGDRGQLKQLMQNLICNALKFGGEEPLVVDVSSRPADDGFLLTVADNGVGVPDGERERIFDPFNRTGRTADRPGTGLGLAICARIVERHGGRIRCEANQPSGTRFVFTLAGALAGSPRPAASSAAT